MAGNKTTEEVQFKEINHTGVYISRTNATYADSVSLLQKNGLRLLTHQEALVFLFRNSYLHERLKGSCFYLAGECCERPSYYRDSEQCYEASFDDQGNLREPRGDLKKIVRVFPGKNPPVLNVHDIGTPSYKGSFDLLGNSDPQQAASFVVGVLASQDVATMLR